MLNILSRLFNSHRWLYSFNNLMANRKNKQMHRHHLCRKTLVRCDIVQWNAWYCIKNHDIVFTLRNGFGINDNPKEHPEKYGRCNKWVVFLQIWRLNFELFFEYVLHGEAAHGVHSVAKWHHGDKYQHWCWMIKLQPTKPLRFILLPSRLLTIHGCFKPRSTLLPLLYRTLLYNLNLLILPHISIVKLRFIIFRK